MITSNNYCSGGGGNSLPGNYAVCARGSEFPSTHNSLGALCAWEACLLLFVFISFYSNFIQLFKCTGFQRGNADGILLS